MNTKSLIILIALALAGCTDQEPNPKPCNCGTVSSISGKSYTIKNYCTSNSKSVYQNTRFKVGDEICISEQW